LGQLIWIAAADLIRSSPTENKVAAVAKWAYVTQEQNFVAGCATIETTFMCDRCELLDKKVERYRWLSGRTSDRAALAGLERLVDQCVSEKIGFHAMPVDKKSKAALVGGLLRCENPTEARNSSVTHVAAIDTISPNSRKLRQRR
jgi:hypothetical protein